MVLVEALTEAPGEVLAEELPREQQREGVVLEQEQWLPLLHP